MKYRSRGEITANILRSVKTGSTKTRIMYDAYLSYTQLKEYLGHLEKNGLICLNKENNLYFVTHNGNKFLNAYDELTELVSPKSGIREKTFLL